MSTWIVPLLVGALLLLGSGLSKLRSPESTVEAARSGGLPATSALVRCFGLVEVVAGVAALAGATGAAVVVALLYAGFAGFLARGLVRGDLESCGCFAGDRSAPSWLHVAVDAALAAAALVVAVGGGGSLVDVLRSPDAPALTLLSLAGAALTYVVLSRLPEPSAAPERLVEGA
jgi:hypothetical protein